MASPLRSRYQLSAGLHWVRRELDQDLLLARQLIEQHSEHPGERGPLEKAIAQLTEVRGSAALLQFYGVALLADEVRQTVQDLSVGRAGDVHAAYAASVSACVQLSDYLDALAGGLDDCALLLQPVINELRLSRGKSLLTEEDLFVAQFNALGLKLPVPTGVRSDGPAVGTEATRLMPVFSAALLSWFKDQDIAQSLSRIGRIAEHMADIAREPALHQLWRTAAACVEALLSRTLEPHLELKRQFGRVGQLLRLIGETGEASAVKHISDVSPRLLFQVGRSAGTGPRVASLRRALELDVWLPSPEIVAQRRARLRGPNTALLLKVAEEVRADLAEIKDSIDLALRSEGQVLDFAGTAQRLKRVSDTLLMLGLGNESRTLAQPLETLQEAGRERPSTTQGWMEFATAVLRVEQSLDGALFRQLRGPGSGVAGEDLALQPATDLREGTGAVLRESLVNLARIKGHVEAYIKSGDLFGLPDAARLLDEVGAAFRILGLGTADELVQTIRQFLQSAAFERVRGGDGTAERFADAIAGVEFFTEMRRDGQPGSQIILDHLVGFVSRLGEAPAPPPEPVVEPLKLQPEEEFAELPAAAAPPAPAEPDTPVAAEPALELSLMDEPPAAAVSAPVEAPALPSTDGLQLLSDTEATAEPAATPVAVDSVLPPADLAPAEAPALSEPPAAPAAEAASAPAPAEEPMTAAPVAAAPVAPSEPEIDAEIREVFLEEAAEVLGLLQRSLPRWMRQPEERELLSEIRRAFHTLKGSGRMVGAREVGEFSWALETLLNRCLDRTIEISQAAIEAVRDAVGLLPALIEAFRDGAPAAPAVATLAATARQIAAGEMGGDGDLVMVFRGDAMERLGMIGRWINDQDGGIGEYDIPEPIVRAFHTLRGAALAVGARPVGELAGSLEAYLGTLHQSHLPLGPAGLELIGDSVRVLGDWVANLGESMPPPVDVQPWLARVEAIRAGAEDEPGALDDDDRQLKEVFSFEALELVQRFESEVMAWSRAPTAMQHARALKVTVHTLKGAAGMAHCAPMAAVAQALNLRLGTLAEGPAPRPGFFIALNKLVEGLYTQLDAYRDGSLSGDGADWVGRVMALDPLAEGPTADAPLPPLDGDDARDSELLEVFLTEGEELLDEIEEHAARVSARPDSAEALGAWNRTLHTLKGSARLAGLPAIGEVTHRLETVTETVMREGAAGHERFRARLRVAVDGLHGLLDDARNGRSGEAAPILQRIEAVQVPMLAPAEPPPQDIPFQAPADAVQLPADDMPAVQMPAAEISAAEGIFDPAEPAAVDEPAPEASTLAMPPPAPEPPAEAAEPPSVVVPAAAEAATTKDIAFDAELAGIFASEGAELLESIQEALTVWRLDPAATEPPREIQRALHTLKGGARIAGLSRMGAAAHALETQVALIEQGRAAADAEGLNDIGRQVEGLLRMQDLIERGQATQLTGVAMEPEPEPEVVAPVAETAAAVAGWDPQLFWRPEAEDAVSAAMRRENARVPVDRLDTMLNQAGEISIFRSRLEENHSALSGSINEMAQTVARVREQLRLLEVETEAQIAARGFSRSGDEEQPGHRYDQQFDALEMDRYSRMQELSRTLAESLSDLGSLHASLDTSASEAETLLQQQGRIVNEVQQSLMSTLMVPFSRQVQRLARVVRQTGEQNGKRARAEFGGADSELDRNVLERMTAPLEHLLRNSVVHGIESPDVRLAAGKPEEGVVQVTLKREGSQLLIEVRDDGSGLDFQAIRAQAIRRGLMRAEAAVTEDDLARFIFAPGFSTAQKLTQDAGRGIGMDVVASEVKQLGGTLDISSETGRGTRFRIRLPLMLAVSQALTVQTGEELFAIPLASVEGIARAPRETVNAMLKDSNVPLSYGGQSYRVLRLGDLVGLPAAARTESRTVPAILIRLGEGLGGTERRVAVLVDRLIGNREIVSKAAGPVLGSVAGVSGATLLADGRVMLILDVPALIQEATRRQLSADAASIRSAAVEESRPLVMVVDDSITIRRVGERLLTRNGYRVITAKDGLDAMALLQTEAPAAILLDIEMPRADGFEVAAFVRNTQRIAHTPIIMITSRSGDKHRDHARSLGVDRYLIKPYQEDQLLAELKTLVGAQRVVDA